MSTTLNENRTKKYYENATRKKQKYSTKKICKEICEQKTL